jgi:hypothetical protein
MPRDKVMTAAITILLAAAAAELGKLDLQQVEV